MLRLVLPNYLDDANSNEQAAIAKLLGAEAAEANRMEPDAADRERLAATFDSAAAMYQRARPE